MADTSTVTLIRESRFFKGIPDEHLENLAGLCRVVDLPAHEHLFNQYDSAREVFILLEGKVSLVMCEPTQQCRQIAEVGEGDLVGWSPIVGRPRLSDTAVTLSRVQSLVFNGSELMDYATKNPAFGFLFMKQAASTLAERLSSTRIQLLEMCGMHFPSFEFQPESD